MIKEIYLNCVLMENGEIIFLDKSLGFLKEIEKEQYVLDASEVRIAMDEHLADIE